ncbi:chromosome segregation protein SMC [Sporosarcina sp. CAU 1771]
MFLKRLEIIGFKSFAERIGIDFVPGVTAIVGPNGSGKSNVADAIRWVLGEQSAKSLRGSKMEDVIFAGSDSRKSLNFAEVTLILDNTKGLFPLDYTEISVSRRVFRSGESVYLLNGQQCRLKDINDVFIDSGLGKEAFSIISQGRVDEILNSRPEDRRSIFDEAAGVLKYRTRKKKAEHKLFETADNLDRVLDILKELETRMGPLKKNAEAAEKHSSLSEEMHEADSTLLNYDAQKLQVEIKEKMNEAQKFQQTNDDLKKTIDRAEEESEQLRAQLSSVDTKLDELQKKLLEVSSESEKWEGRRLLSAEKRRNADQQLERIQGELDATLKEQEILSVRLQTALDNLGVTKENYEKVSVEIDDISHILKRSVKETEHEIEELKSQYIDRLNEEATVRNDLKHLEERLEGEKSSSEKMLHQTQSLKEHLRELSSDRKARESSLIELKQTMKEAELNHVQSTKELREAEANLKEKQELLQKALNKQYEMQGRMKALQSMEADFSGFYSGVKEVLIATKSGKLRGINGAVAELLSVDGPYVKAVETALGGAMQHVVTSTEGEARKAIAYLKSRNAGRATFLPLDVIKPRRIPVSTLQIVERHPDFVGTGDSLVSSDAAYQTITENLLGNVLVASSLSGASEIAKSIGYRFRVVTTDGDIVNAGGSLTGGGVKGQASVFTRKAELETLRGQLVQIASSIERGSKMIGDTKMSVSKRMQETERIRSLFATLQHEATSGESRIREMDITIRTVESEINSAELGRKGSENTGTALIEKKKELHDRHVLIKETLEKLKVEVETLERLAANWRKEEAALINQRTELREKAAVLREQKNHQESSITDLKQTIEGNKRKLILLNEEKSYFAGSDEGGQLTSQEILDRIEVAKKDKDKTAEKIARNRERRIELVKSTEEKVVKLRNIREAMDKSNRALNEVTVGLSRLEVKFESITSRLLNEYGLYPDAGAIVKFDEKATREKLSELKQELSAIGVVNPSAIAEFAEVSERHEFLTEQRNDLLNAKNTLQEAMSEMDAEMTARFSSTFDAVQSRFRSVFKEMFGGGDADLILTQPNKLLETGVDIVARPPGKKLQNLSLLSGGERALTAISLLFSIIEVRPVPFCILDEVEAALDEANVNRFSKYLNRFSENTQFIVVTHRKGTMEGADVLYGITMQESGVSKLISVKISEVPAEAMV